MKAIIVGAGIGGLATAIALRNEGIEVAIFEREPSLERLQVGYGIHLWSNATRGLAMLGVGDRVESVGERFDRMQFLTLDGDVLVDWPVDELGRRLGSPTVGIN